jgi:hypothetical protein
MPMGTDTTVEAAKPNTKNIHSRLRSARMVSLVSPMRISRILSRLFQRLAPSPGRPQELGGDQ